MSPRGTCTDLPKPILALFPSASLRLAPLSLDHVLCRSTATCGVRPRLPSPPVQGPTLTLSTFPDTQAPRVLSRLTRSYVVRSEQEYVPLTFFSARWRSLSSLSERASLTLPLEPAVPAVHDADGELYSHSSSISRAQKTDPIVLDLQYARLGIQGASSLLGGLAYVPCSFSSCPFATPRLTLRSPLQYRLHPYPVRPHQVRQEDSRHEQERRRPRLGASLFPLLPSPPLSSLSLLSRRCCRPVVHMTSSILSIPS